VEKQKSLRAFAIAAGNFRQRATMDLILARGGTSGKGSIVAACKVQCGKLFHPWVGEAKPDRPER
jgi:hypothetical protein